MMRPYFAIHALTLVCIAFSAFAQEPAVKNAETAAPAPDRLTADWWIYFSPEQGLALDVLDQRISQNRDLLNRAVERRV